MVLKHQKYSKLIPAFSLVEKGYVSASFLNWVFILLLSVIAIMATIGTADWMALIIAALAFVFLVFNMFTLSGYIIGFGLMVAFFVALKGWFKK